MVTTSATCHTPGPGAPQHLHTNYTPSEEPEHYTVFYIFLRSYVWVILHITYSSKAPNVLVDIALDISTYLYVCVSVSPYLQSSAKPAGCWLVPGFCLELAFGQFWVRTPPAAAAAAGWYISSGKSQGETLKLTSDTEFIAWFPIIRNTPPIAAGDNREDSGLSNLGVAKIGFQAALNNKTHSQYRQWWPAERGLCCPIPVQCGCQVEAGVGAGSSGSGAN